MSPRSVPRGRPNPEPTALVVRKHHLLVRLSHWGNVPLLLGDRKSVV